MRLKQLNTITSSLRVLYVEDDKLLREQNKELFKELFSSIKVAKDGEEALWFYENEKFDIVITDINIPKLNGLSLIKKIKEKNQNQKILVTTVYKKEDLKEQLKKLNICHLLTKPISTKDLLEQIEELVYESVT